MTEKPRFGPANPHPFAVKKTELIWEGKYDGDGKRYIVETKGQEDVNVANKDRAAAIWCENATILTGENWAYLKVKQSEYTKLQADTFADLGVLGQGILPLR